MQKIDGFALKTLDMAIVGFFIQDKLRKSKFFKETFLLSDTSIEDVLKCFFWRSVMEAFRIMLEVLLRDPILQLKFFPQLSN